ncbi:MAG: GNAT family N-acetyltransferase [Ruminococcaceae bacterium]|nr:GNAT family N-acetyltransferase [Oscillospiraceae bacterium]
MAFYELTPAQQEDFPRCMQILQSGRDFQRQQGFVQWPDNFPDADVVARDISSGFGFVLKADGIIAAYCYLGLEGDPSYPEIKGAWRYDEPYVVLHRVAISPEFRGKGLTGKLFSLVEEFAKKRNRFVLRIDTAEPNARMQHVVEKAGFAYCGTVIQGGGLRLAYDKKI